MPSLVPFAHSSIQNTNIKRKIHPLIYKKSLIKRSRTNEKLSPSQLPVEIWDLILQNLLASQNLFSTIAAFSLVCSTFRQIAFRQYFRHLRLCNLSMVSLLLSVPGFPGWIHSLQASASCLSILSARLPSFTALCSVHISFLGQTLITQSNAILSLLLALPPHISSLTLLHLAEIDTLTLTLLGTRFTELRTLELSCSERLDTSCCWQCFEESASCVCFSPLPDRYGTLANLAKALKNALGGITHLRHLHLGFFLSHGDVLYDHFRHAQNGTQPLNAPPTPNTIDDDDNDDTNNHHDPDPNPIPTSPTLIHPTSPATSPVPQPNPSQPFGPEWCDLCFAVHASSVRSDELDVSLSLARHFRELESVGWSTFFGKKWEEIERRRTTVWVKRSEGKVKVRRKPW